jgi:hypothetical protein
MTVSVARDKSGIGRGVSRDRRVTARPISARIVVGVSLRTGTWAVVAVVAFAAGPANAAAAASSPARSAAAKRAVTRAYEGYVGALALGHGRSVCRRMTASGRNELMAAAGVWSPWRATCPEAVTKLRGVIREPRHLTEVRIFGTLASARLPTGDYRFFARAGRRWKIAATGATNPFRPARPPPRAAPSASRFLGVDWDRVPSWADDAADWAQDATRWRWFAPTLAAALLLLVLLLVAQVRHYRRRSFALNRSLEELTARAHRVLSASVASAPPVGPVPESMREDLAILMRINKELVARLDAAQGRSEEMTRRLLDELARTGADNDQAARLQARLARSESARAEAQAEIQALQEHVRHLRERVIQLPE